MYQEESKIEVVHLQKDILVTGYSLQRSGLPITFDSMGTMWERYTEEMKETTPNSAERRIEYGVCINKIPDYIVGIGVTKLVDDTEEYSSYKVPAGDYIKASFNAIDHDELVNDRLMKMMNEAFKWAKQNNLTYKSQLTVEVYPKETIDKEYPEMYLLISID